MAITFSAPRGWEPRPRIDIMGSSTNCKQPECKAANLQTFKPSDRQNAKTCPSKVDYVGDSARVLPARRFGTKLKL